MIASPLPIEPQPDGRSCGPTCLHAVYRFHGVDLPLGALVEAIDQLELGGTLAVQLGTHALQHGFEATVYTYNLQIFDPSWFHPGAAPLDVKLHAQRAVKDDARLHDATGKYLEFLRLGGRVRHAPLSPGLLAQFLGDGLPILTGLSSTYLYDAKREVPEDDTIDDLRGHPVGHFVVIHGIDLAKGVVQVADPWPNHEGRVGTSTHPTWRVLTAIALGVLTYDANLLVLRRHK